MPRVMFFLGLLALTAFNGLLGVLFAKLVPGDASRIPVLVWSFASGGCYAWFAAPRRWRS